MEGFAWGELWKNEFLVNRAGLLLAGHAPFYNSMYLFLSCHTNICNW